MALYYVRLGEGASDLVIQEYDLDDIIRKAIRKYAGQFIRRKIRVVYEGTDQKVITDEKMAVIYHRTASLQCGEIYFGGECHG